MIVSHLIGGLGNQMFQYAAGRSTALTLGVDLRLHVADYAGYGLHQGFELGRIFNSSFMLISNDELHAALGWRSGLYCRRMLRYRYFAAFRGRRFVVEPFLQFWPEIRDVQDNSYLVGYWQSEKYFSNIQSVIRSDFVFKEELSAKNAAIATKIQQCNAISLHVRRGDYVSDAKTNAMLGLCSLKYYSNAVRYIAERVESPEFFVFSDDIAWVKENLDIGHPCEYVDHNTGLESYNDMRLMSMCTHHIIANSSFSWWGAWLNPNTEKIVVAPEKWFASGSLNEDLLPESWVRL